MTKTEAIEKLLHAEQLLKEVAQVMPKTHPAFVELEVISIRLHNFTDELKDFEFYSIETM